MSTTTVDLADLRKQISAIDDQILGLIQSRMECSRQVGEYKRQRGLPIKDYGVEKQIIDRVRDKAQAYGFNEDLGESIFKTLIEFSCRIQDDLLKSEVKAAQKDALQVVVIGGFGQMGYWFSDYFRSMGHRVSIFDTTRATEADFPVEKALASALDHKDIILVATPLAATHGILTEIIALKPKGIIVEICSLKSPVMSALIAAGDAGLAIASIHPMFGPGVSTLAGRNILFCETPHNTHTATIKALFQNSSANLIDIPLQEHDVLMSYVLGSSHLTNLLFASVIRRNPFAIATLNKVAGTTFRKQLEVTSDVVFENQDLYFDIQALNSETMDLIQSFGDCLTVYRQALAAQDRDAFKQEMSQAKAFIAKT